MTQFSTRPLTEWTQIFHEAASHEDRYHALLAINSISPPPDAVHWNQLALKDTDPGIRARAARQLGEWNQRDLLELGDAWSEVSTDLTDRLSDEDPDVRFEAARALGIVNPQVTTARDVLLSLLTNPDSQPLMIAAVVSALGHRTDLDINALIPALKIMLAHSQAEIRENTSELIAHNSVATGALVHELLIALDDEEPIVRENAATALGRSGTTDPQVLSGLQAAEQDDDEGVAEAAHLAREHLSHR